MQQQGCAAVLRGRLLFEDDGHWPEVMGRKAARGAGCLTSLFASAPSPCLVDAGISALLWNHNGLFLRFTAVIWAPNSKSYRFPPKWC